MGVTTPLQDNPVLVGTKSSLLQVALLFNARRFNVIPLHSPLMGPIPNRLPQDWGKVPLVDLAPYQERHSTREEIEGWWRQWPHANIGVPQP